MKSNLLLSGIILLGLSACASRERKVDNLAVDTSATNNPSSEILKIEAEVAEGRTKGMQILSPTWFWSAERSLAEAKQLRDNGKDLPELFKEVAESRAQLEEAKKYAGVSEKVLADAIAARRETQQARDGANKSGAVNLADANKDFLDADREFTELTAAVEDGDVEEAQAKQKELVANYEAVTKDFIKLDKLGPARRILAEAKDNDAGKYAPKTLAFAENYIQTADKFIDGSPKATKEIDAQSQQALMNAKRALLLAQQSKELKAKDPEETVLWVESKVTNLNQLLGAKSQPDIRLDQQFRSIESEAQRLAMTEKGLSRDANRLERELKDTRPLARMDAKLKDLRDLFSPREADVVSMDGKVVLRLKGLHFPVGKATLESENFPLLAKAQEALAAFPAAEIEIQGHTDASGSPEVNAKLSAARAETVKNYLLSSEAVSEEVVSAVGKGYSEPIASNRTKEGRASNRRIDIVIDAEKATE